MLDASQACVVVVTRGNCDMAPILHSVPQEMEVVIWDNSQREDLAVYGRYAAISLTERPVILTTDDDVILPPDTFTALLEAYEPGRVVANMPERFRHDFYEEHCLVGFGAIFDRELPDRAFKDYSTDQNSASASGSPYPALYLATTWDLLFPRCCDITFTALTPRTLVDLPYEEREFATGPDRMYRQAGHVGERGAMLKAALRAKEGVASWGSGRSS